MIRLWAMRLPAPGRVLMLMAVLVCAAGCGGYWPLRAPQRDLWVAAPVEPEPVRMPVRPLKDFSHQLRQGGLTVALELLDSTQAQESFQLNLAHKSIQPVLLAIHNRSDQTYAFRKADFGRAAVIPASRVAGMRCPHPVRVAGGYVKWLAFLIPGLLFETVIEPATTFDFPIMRETSRRPGWPSCRASRQMFLAQELADGDIPPGSSRAGVVFLRPVKLDNTFTVTLRDAQTQQPLALVLPTPASTVSRTRLDRKPSTIIWPAALASARRISSWRVRSADAQTGVIRIDKRSELAPWSQPMPVTVTIRPLDAGRTQVTAESPLREPLSTSLGTASQTIEHFFLELARQLPPPPPVPPPAPAGTIPLPAT